jgi:glucokinase
MNRIFAIDIGGTKSAVSLADGSGRIIETREFTTTSPDSTLARVRTEVAALAPGPDPVFGIACGGPLDTEAGLILGPANLPGWDRVAVIDMLQQRFGGEAYLMNDANAGALAEWYWGAGRDSDTLIFLTAGTGMGAGLILDGRLYEGCTGSAGEVGHMRLAPDGPVGIGKAGSFEGFCSGGGIARLARRMMQEYGDAARINERNAENVTAQDVGAAAAAGDEFAREILTVSGRYLGAALAVLIDVLNPEVIVIGNMYRRCRKFLEPPMREALAREALPAALSACRIVPPALGDRIGPCQAVAVAMYRKGMLKRE